MPSAHPRMLLGLIAALCGAAGCRGADTEQVVAGHHELCCKAANADNLGFVGCRASRSCRTSERVWVRGPVTCAPLDAEHCAGGRCCKLDLEAIATLDLDPAALVDGPEPDGVDAVEEPPTPAPEPAPIVPVPMDWQARPTAVVIPKLLCPATLDRGVVGSVELQVAVDVGGRVTNVQIRSGIDPQCDTLAREALLHAEFEPARTPGGQAIASSSIWVYEFTRDGGG